MNNISVLNDFIDYINSINSDTDILFYFDDINKFMNNRYKDKELVNKILNDVLNSKYIVEISTDAYQIIHNKC